MFRPADPTEKLLAALSIFEGLRPRERRRIVRHFIPVTVPAGTALIQQETGNHHTYFVVSGRLDVEVDGTHVASVGPDEVVGERTMFGPFLANATVTAAVDSEVLIVDHRALLVIAADHPAVGEWLRGVDAARRGAAPAA